LTIIIRVSTADINPKLPASSLDLKDVIQIFDLRYNQLFDAWALADNELCEIPALLGIISCVDLIDTNFLQSLSRMSICLSQKGRWQMKLSRGHRLMTFSSSVSAKRSDLLFGSITNLTRRRQRNYLPVLQLRLPIQLLFSCDSKPSSTAL